MKNGLHKNVSREAYDLQLLDRVNYSSLKVLGLKSPAHYKHLIDTRPTTLAEYEEAQGKTERDVLLAGEATHVAALEPALYGGEDAEYLDPLNEPPPAKGRFLVFKGTRDARHDKYKKVLARAALGGQKILTQEMHETAQAISLAVRSNMEAAPYIAGGERELTVLWDYEEPQVANLDGWTMPMRARLDYLTDAAIIDLKSTFDASPEAFAKQMWNNGCYVQAAMQQDGVAAITRRIRPYYWLAVEKTPPYVVAIYEPDHDDLRRARDTYRDWLRKLHVLQTEEAAAIERGESFRWPGYTGGAIMSLPAPRWARPREEVEY